MWTEPSCWIITDSLASVTARQDIQISMEVYFLNIWYRSEEDETYSLRFRYHNTNGVTPCIHTRVLISIDKGKLQVSGIWPQSGRYGSTEQGGEHRGRQAQMAVVQMPAQQNTAFLYPELPWRKPGLLTKIPMLENLLLQVMDDKAFWPWKAVQ